MSISVEPKSVHEILVEFMESIEEWQSTIAGTPSENDMKELHKIYDISEVELRFTINNESREVDSDEATKSLQANTTPAEN